MFCSCVLAQFGLFSTFLPHLTPTSRGSLCYRLQRMDTTLLLQFPVLRLPFLSTPTTALVLRVMLFNSTSRDSRPLDSCENVSQH